ncbi:cation diffusion facilitator family transporter [Sphaerobacter thermophilus]|uniref:cation diffusion facilitator family transporter n=1 Tax=Sphaerobacter thermophilus TaxID=2057 RepID=UPI0039C2C531
MHDHAIDEHAAIDRPRERVHRRPLVIALAISAIFLVVEVVGGLVTNSLALLADAGHMATDVAALALALFAAWLAGRPATPQHSFGLYRTEVLAAVVNGAGLIVIALLIFWEAARRFTAPPTVDSGPMLVVAVAGLVANAASAWVLSRGGGHEHNLNIRGAFLHVVGDLLGSVGAIVAALIMLATGWYLADPILSAGIGLLILWSAARLLRDSLDVLLEATPRHIDAEEVRAAMMGVDGVMNVHDLHIWTVTSGFVSLSAHVEVDEQQDWHAILLDLSALLRERFGIAHVTLQPEAPQHLPAAFRGCSLDTAEGRNACLMLFPRIPPRHNAPPDTHKPR